MLLLNLGSADSTVRVGSPWETPPEGDENSPLWGLCGAEEYEKRFASQFIELQ